MKLELTEDGFSAINEKIAEMQDRLARGIIEPAKAVQVIRDTRSDLYSLSQLMKAKVVIANTEPDGPDIGPIGA